VNDFFLEADIQVIGAIVSVVPRLMEWSPQGLPYQRHQPELIELVHTISHQVAGFLEREGRKQLALHDPQPD